MRTLFVLIVLAAMAFLAWTYRAPLTGAAQRLLPQAAHDTGDRAPATKISAAALPAPTAPPGVYYATERVTTETQTGVKALNPGDEVRLMYRHKNGTMLVTNGRDEFLVKPSALTRDRGQSLPQTAQSR